MTNKHNSNEYMKIKVSYSDKRYYESREELDDVLMKWIEHMLKNMGIGSNWTIKR